jgi:AraC-like DNA-binding protein
MTVTTETRAPDAAVVGRDERWVRKVAGTDQDEAQAFFTAGYDLKDPEIRRTESRFRWDFAGVGDGTVSLRTCSLMADLRSTTRSEDDYMVVWNRQGTTEIRAGGHTERLRRGVPMLLPFGREYELHHSDVALSLVHIDKRAVERAVGENDPRFDSFAPLSAEAVAIWQGAVRSVSPRFLDMEHPANALERRSIADVLIDAFIRTVPRDRLPGTEGHGPEYERLLRAVEFVHSHAHLPIGTPEIAAAADLSARGVQQSFKRHLDTTPGEFLRGVRLEHVRSDLRRSDSGVTTVAEIARSWGFGHLGRFSAAYRQRFGEFPSETLRDKA